MKRYLLPILLAFLLLTSPVSAHPGRTDANGGHYDHSDGSYHYHTGEYAGRPQSGSSSSGSNQPFNPKDRTDQNADDASPSRAIPDFLIPDFSGSDEDNLLLSCYALALLAVIFLSALFEPVQIAMILVSVALGSLLILRIFFPVFVIAACAFYAFFFVLFPIANLLTGWIKALFPSTYRTKRTDQGTLVLDSEEEPSVCAPPSFALPYYDIASEIPPAPVVQPIDNSTVKEELPVFPVADTSPAIEELPLSTEITHPNSEWDFFTVFISPTGTTFHTNPECVFTHTTPVSLPHAVLDLNQKPCAYCARTHPDIVDFYRTQKVRR